MVALIFLNGDVKKLGEPHLFQHGIAMDNPISVGRTSNHARLRLMRTGASHPAKHPPHLSCDQLRFKLLAAHIPHRKLR